MSTTGDGLQQWHMENLFIKARRRGTTYFRNAWYICKCYTLARYGIMQWQNPGHISTAYTVNGSASPQTTTFCSDGQRNPYTDLPNYLFFHSDLTPGNHTLVITVTEITDQLSFLLHYIFYTAAFDSLAAMPALTPGDIHPWTPPHAARAKKAFPKGTIVGAALGAAVLLALIVSVVYCMTRRRCPKLSGDCPEINPLPELVVRPSEPLSYTPMPMVSLYQLSHTDVGASSVGGYTYPRGSFVAGLSSLTSHPPTALLPHSQHHPPCLRPLSHSPGSLTAPTSPSVLSSSPSIPIDALNRPDSVHLRLPVSEKWPKSEKHTWESMVIHQAHHPQAARRPSRQSNTEPHVHVYHPENHELRMSPADINVYHT